MTARRPATEEMPPALPGRAGDPARRFPSLRDNRGIALLLVLWLLVLLSVMALSFSGTARTQARIARNLHDNAQARWMADAGVRLAVRDLWRADEGRNPAADGRTHFCTFQSGTLAISIRNVSGLIDLNAAPVATLESLFAAAGAGKDARRLAEAVADFRDRDDRPEPDGAEAPAYEAAGLAHGPRNGGFQAVEELEQVLGMPDDLVTRIAPAVTVHSGRPAPDLRIAPPLVRSAHGEAYGAAAISSAPSAVKSGGPFAVTVTAKTASGALFVRRAVLSVRHSPFPSYRVLRWGRTAAPTVTDLPGREDLPPC